MNRLPNISIVIPVYNVEKYIEECIGSVITQKYTGHIQCLLIDDCGSDRSMQIAQQIVDRYNGPISFHIIHHSKNMGLSEARNTGIKAAEGEYILFLDSDDYLEPICLETLVRPILHRPYDFVVGYNNVINRERTAKRCLKLPEGECLGNNIIKEFVSENLNVVAWNKLIDINFIRKNNLYFKAGLIHEDDLWSFQASYFAKAIYVVESPRTYTYRVRLGSIMTKESILTESLSRADILASRKSFVNQHSDLANDNDVEEYLERTRIHLLEITSRLGWKEQLHIFKKFYPGIRTPKPHEVRSLKHKTDFFNYFHSPIIAGTVFYLTKKIAEIWSRR